MPSQRTRRPTAASGTKVRAVSARGVRYYNVNWHGHACAHAHTLTHIHTHARTHARTHERTQAHARTHAHTQEGQACKGSKPPRMRARATWRRRMMTRTGMRATMGSRWVGARMCVPFNDAYSPPSCCEATVSPLLHRSCHTGHTASCLPRVLLLQPKGLQVRLPMPHNA